MNGTVALARRLVAEAVGAGLLVAVVVGSGIAAARLSPDDVGLQLLENSLATGGGLAVLIAWLGPVSGGHFNPAVSIADWWLGRESGTGLSVPDLGAYVAAQLGGGVVGAMLANVMFAEPVARWSTTERTGGGLWLAEVVATAGLVALIFALIRTDRPGLVAPLVGTYIGAAYWWTSSTSFANPAVTVGRSITDTFAGIAPSSVPGFLAAQLVGAGVGVLLVKVLHPLSALRRRQEATSSTHPEA
ncbi:MAG: aquaporin family protein [Propionibacteriales bacterium]|nr:aquaporin family protein [Propionibacteriales bacterium]